MIRHAAIVLWSLLAAAQPPVTRKDNFREVLHGVEVIDPYRWLEDQESAETRRWIDEQNKYSDSILGRLPARESILKRLDELSAQPAVGVPDCRGAYCYVARREPGAQTSVIYRRPAGGGDEELVFDPLRFAPEKSVSAGFLRASRDGRILAYALRRGGEDETEIRFRDVAKRQDLPVKIARHLNRGFALQQDGKGCYYTNHDRSSGPRIRHLDLVTGQERLVFGEGFSPAEFISPQLIADDRYLLISASKGWASNDLYWLDLAKDATVRPIVKGIQAHFNAIDGGDRLFVRTDWKAPRYRLFSASFERPEQSAWREIVPQQEDVLGGVTAAGGKLFLEYLHNVTTRIGIHEPGGRKLGEMPLPGAGTASISGRPRQPTAYVSFATFSTPATILEYDTRTGRQTPYFRALPAWKSEDFEVKQVWCTSKDGTRVPMFLAHRKGLKADGNLPVLLTGYGGFNVSLTPQFNTRGAIWMERGGVWAMANLRGGSEFGEEWHRAGMLENKQNVFDDFIAAAEWLIANKYTNPARLAILGGSNGGLLVGAALTQRPDLFRAVVCTFPDLDMVGYWRFPNNNKPALLEYGDASKPEQFRYLLKYSPYQNVKEGTKYPAVLLVSGDRDTRVPPLQARKMTARLQAATTSGLPVLLHYETETGHVGAVRRSEQIQGPARELAFLFWQLGME